MPFELSGTEVLEVDETRWPWSAIRRVDGQMEGMGWPWSTIPESRAEGLSVQQRHGWADEAVVLHWFDMRYDASYFQAVAVVLEDTLARLVYSEDRGADDGGDEGTRHGTHGAGGAAIEATGEHAGTGRSTGGTGNPPVLH